MQRILCVEDPIMFVWACVLAFVLEFEFALLLLRGFYGLRRGLLGIPESPTQRMRPTACPLYDLRARKLPGPEETEPTAELRYDPTHDTRDGAHCFRDPHQLRAE